MRLLESEQALRLLKINPNRGVSEQT